jgi:RNA polymerase sigma-70 factor (ECF subfamily)
MAPDPEHKHDFDATMTADDPNLVSGVAKELSTRQQQAAFSDLYVKHHRAIATLCRAILRDRTDAEDAVEEVFTKAWRAMLVHRSEGYSYPWLRTVARNHCFDLLRKRKRAHPAEHSTLELLCPPFAGSDEAIGSSVDVALVRESLHRVSARHRSILNLREGAELSYQQIADREHIPVSTVESRLYRARQAIRREFLALARPRIYEASSRPLARNLDHGSKLKDTN